MAFDAQTRTDAEWQNGSYENRVISDSVSLANYVRFSGELAGAAHIKGSRFKNTRCRHEINVNDPCTTGYPFQRGRQSGGERESFEIV